jgi:DNA uptake protein ComE-like DNA-binding protein
MLGRLLLLAVLAATPVGKGDLLDINTATPAQLAGLPGMGREYVRRVIANRPYTAKNQLVTRGILPPEEYARIAGKIVAHRPGTTPSFE